jgi:hypothetical protein
MRPKPLLSDLYFFEKPDRIVRWQAVLSLPLKKQRGGAQTTFVPPSVDTITGDY